MYEISRDYVSYLSPFAPHLFHNSKSKQANERKYIGIILQVNGMDYFVPLSSFKPKHKRMPDMIDFIKIRDYAVINLNNMFPVPRGEYSYVDFSSVKDPRYKSLLLAEYRYIKSIKDAICQNAADLYQYKLEHKDDTTLAKRCNDFALLESKCAEYKTKAHT
ncbi:MAG: type III toxin-antitoxin system ToxN/AbiQ family toxin [Lachnospiraceae bacterium]|nr:type III toxin-antitoxin system ToxN/AbiQ family toxin [Ruminococcus sp.]MCM1277027.1 type III toxin-antitoxin system ToxN/AbiQ family toxin [Lachnospiraceae bacterium]